MGLCVFVCGVRVRVVVEEEEEEEGGGSRMELMRRFKVLRHFWARAARVRNRTGARIQMRPLAAPPTSQVRGLLPLLVSDTGPTTWTTRCPSSPTNQARSAWRWPGAGGVQAAQAPAASRSLCTSCRRRFPMVPREGARGLPQLGVVCVCVCVGGGGAGAVHQPKHSSRRPALSAGGKMATRGRP